MLDPVIGAAVFVILSLIIGSMKVTIYLHSLEPQLFLDKNNDYHMIMSSNFTRTILPFALWYLWCLDSKDRNTEYTVAYVAIAIGCYVITTALIVYVYRMHSKFKKHVGAYRLLVSLGAIPIRGKS